MMVMVWLTSLGLQRNRGCCVMTEWSSAITFAIAMLVLACTIGLGISNVTVSNNAGQEINDNLDTKIQNTSNYTSQIKVENQDYATAQVTLRSVLTSTPCYINGVNGKHYLYYNLYSGVQINPSTGQITGKVGAKNLSEEIFSYMSANTTKTYTFTTGSNANIINRHGSYIVME